MSIGQIIARVLIVAVLMAICAFSAAFSNTLVGYLPLIVLILALIACFLYVRILSRAISVVSSGVEESCLRGEMAEFAITVSNPTIVPFVRTDVQIRVQSPFEDDDDVAIKPCLLGVRGSYDFYLRFPFEHIGLYRVGVEQMRLSDPFGLFCKTFDVNVMSEVQVLPRISDLDGLIIDPKAVVESQRLTASVASDGMDYVAVREYVPGDPIKAVHWKLSARANMLLTRLYETHTNPGTSVFVDVACYRYDSEELAMASDLLIEVLFSFVAIARNAGFDVELLFRGKSGEVETIGASAFDDPESVLRELPMLHVVSEDDKAASEDFADIVQDQAYNPRRQSTFAIVTAAPTSAVVNAALSVGSANRTPLVFACIPTMEDYQLERDRVRPLDVLEEAGVFHRRFSALAQVEGGVM